jgi:hypothetical protein
MMRKATRLALAVVALAFSAQGVTAQLAEKKILTSIAVRQLSDPSL